MILALSDFWEWFFLLLIWVPLVMLWGVALIDIFKRDDMGGPTKALWIVIIFVLPWIGVFIYLIARPKTAPVT
jgi:Phospholipase_D-nuclease N-terminal